MFGYIYLTENLVNGKCYIGKRQKPKFDKAYIGSGSNLKKAIKKYGRNNFVCQPIQWCETEDELLKAEAYWVDRCNAVKDPMFYNCVPGGGKSADMSGENNPFWKCTHTDETKQVMHERKQELVASGWHPWNYGLPTEDNPLTGRHYHTDEFKQELAKRNRDYQRTQEYRDQMSASQKKRYEEHPELRDNCSKIAKERIANGTLNCNTRSIRIICYYKGEYYKTFESIKEASQHFGVTKVTVGRQVVGNAGKLKDYLFIKEATEYGS